MTDDENPRPPLWQPHFPSGSLPDYDLTGAPPPTSDAGSKVRRLLQEAVSTKRQREDNTSEASADFLHMPSSASPPQQPQAAPTVAKPKPLLADAMTRSNWMNLVDFKCGKRRVRDASLLLHNELVTFRDFVGPSEEEEAARAWVAQQVRDVATELWPESITVVFGSASTGLSLPDSDVDIVVFNGPKRAIHTLSQSFKSREMVDYLEVIDKARIPIIKLRFKGCEYTADVSFGEEGGPRTGALIRSILDALPEARPLILVVKMFLAQRELNETFRGGVGSFLCFLTVISIVQRARRMYPGQPQNLGCLLVSYFDFFGNILNYNDVGISLLEGGSYFSKHDKSWFSPERPFLLSFENPEKPELDVGRNSWNIESVKRSFAFAHRALVAKMSSFDPREKPESILASIIRLDVLANRHPREA